MITTAFGDMNFNIGWKTKTIIKIFDIDYQITVKLKAYNEKLSITEEQIQTCQFFCDNTEKIINKIENLLLSYKDRENLTPTTLLVKRNGDYAILFNNNNDADNGIAVCLTPKEEILSLDQFL